MAGAKERQRRGGGRKANLSPFSLSLSTHGFDERLPACSINQLSLKALTLFPKRVLCNISLPDIQMKKAIATETLFNYFRERACHPFRGWQFFTRASLLSPRADIEFLLIAIELPSFFPFLKKKMKFYSKILYSAYRYSKKSSFRLGSMPVATQREFMAHTMYQAS